MTITAYVDGQEGTTGLRIHEYLAQRPDVDVLRIAPELRKDVAERQRLLNAADVVFLCLPDSAAREAASWVVNPRTCVIDASTAHRTDPGWCYGMPELVVQQRASIAASKRIANPGCHATGFILLLRPLVDAGLLPPRQFVSATSITGYSGGGKKMIEQYASGTDPSLLAPRPYALGLAHKHLPEMALHARLARPPVFLPIVSPFYKGMAVSVPMSLADLGTSAEALHRAFVDHYGGEPFIRVQPLNEAATLEAGHFDVQGANDTNRVDLFVFVNGDHVLLMARLDNLGKGASGAAVQTMNVHFGLEEGLGL